MRGLSNNKYMNISTSASSIHISISQTVFPSFLLGALVLYLSMHHPPTFDGSIQFFHSSCLLIYLVFDARTLIEVEADSAANSRTLPILASQFLDLDIYCHTQIPSSTGDLSSAPDTSISPYEPCPSSTRSCNIYVRPKSGQLWRAVVEGGCGGKWSVSLPSRCSCVCLPRSSLFRTCTSCL